MKKALLLYLFIGGGVSVFAQDVVVFEKGNKFGVRNADNKQTIVKAQYDYILPLNDNYLLIENEKKIGIVSKKGRVVFAPLYDDVQGFGEDNFLVSNNNRWGIIDLFGRIVLPVEYSWIEPLDNYLYILYNEGKKGLINRFGKILLAPNYDEITPLPDNLFLVQSGSNIGLIDDLGTVVINPGRYNFLEKMSPFNLYKVQVGNKWGIIDLAGKTVVDPVLDEIDYSQDRNYITVRKDGKYGFIINKQYVPARYDKIVFTQDELGIIAVKQGRLNGFITTNGVIVSPVYDNISRFSPKGFAFVEKKGKLMFVDITGRERSLQHVAGNGGAPAG